MIFNFCVQLSIGFNFITSNANLHPTAGISFYQDCTPIGVFESSATSFKIYPNPSEGRIKIEFEDDFRIQSTIRVTDLFGRVHFLSILNRNNNSILQELNFSDLPKGIYLLEIIGPFSKSSRKLILK
ncbi:MAG: T9SS type A sorting domain-containing protein [Bacteroidia bacterium]|nr:T9SS type A sorting domain-containing protein [Bacteroidia bacterium]